MSRPVADDPVDAIEVGFSKGTWVESLTAFVITVVSRKQFRLIDTMMTYLQSQSEGIERDLSIPQRLYSVKVCQIPC